MSVSTGTAHFRSVHDAVEYYRPYGYEDVKYAVECKLRDGEIHIGRPSVKPGESLRIDEDGRYWIKED